MIQLLVGFKAGFFEVGLGRQVRRVGARKLAAASLLRAVDDLTGGKTIKEIQLDLAAAPRSRARTVQIVMGVLARRFGIRLKENENV